MPLTRNDLQLGDILMTKYQGGGIHRVISGGSFLAGNFGTSSYVHAQIVCREGPVEIAESHAEGLHIEAPYSPATVFRLKQQGGALPAEFAAKCARKAAGVAVELTGRQQPTEPFALANMMKSVTSLFSGSQPQTNDSFGKYSIFGAAKSLFTRVTVDDGVVRHLRAISSGTSNDRLFCSQFVVVCYQVAILRLSDKGKSPPKVVLPLGVDSKAMEPAYLVSYLRQNSQHWEEVGDFPGGTN